MQKIELHLIQLLSKYVFFKNFGIAIMTEIFLYTFEDFFKVQVHKNIGINHNFFNKF